MILTDVDIARERDAGRIVVEPFEYVSLGSNSYDVHLGDTLLTYDGSGHLDCKREPTTREHHIPEEGFLLVPGELYLASTVEYTESHATVPFLEGKSSLGRLGMSIHVTAGKGDVGFCGYWTMEITVVKPLRVYAGMPVGQLIWFTIVTQPTRDYFTKPTAKYTNRDPKPQASRMHLNFPQES